MYFTFLLLFSGLGLIDVKNVDSIHAKIGTYEGITDPKCGYSCHKLNYLPKCMICLNKKRGQMSQKLTGALSAREGEFPWMVSFQSNTTQRHFCSGTLLNRNWIITAAHCLKGYKNIDSFYIRTGSNRVNKGNIERAVKYYIHPRYNLTDPTGPFDLALVLIDNKSNQLKKKKKLNFSPINSICLPQKDIQNNINENAFYSGFGRIDYKGVRATSLMKSQMTLLPDNRCLDYISQFNMACLRSSTSHTCKGDSGSPLIQYVKNRAVLIGIHKGSTRIRGACGMDRAVTTRVSKFIDWIVDTIRRHQKKNKIIFQ